MGNSECVMPIDESSTDFDFPIESTRSIQTPYGEQDENGTDLSLIRENLRLSPLERLRQGDAATTGVLRLREYGRRIETKSS